MKIEHILKKWEKNHGYIYLLSHDRRTFSQLKGKRFMVIIGSEVIFERQLDSQGRLYLGKRPLQAFKAGDKLTILFEDDVLIIKKATN